MDIEKINVGGTQYDVCDTVARAALSDEFSTGGTYAVGDYCIYENTLYKFTAAKEPGAWDASKVAATQIGDELSQLNGKTISETQTLATGVSIAYNGLAATLSVDFAEQQTFDTGWNSICAIPEKMRPKFSRLRFSLIDNYAQTNDDNYPLFCRILNGDFAIYVFPSRLTVQPVGSVTYVL